MAKLNLTSGETIDGVPMLVAIHGYVVNSIELTGKDVTAMRRLFERDPAGFRAFIIQFEMRFPENRRPKQGSDAARATSFDKLALGDMPSYGNCSANDMLAAVADAIFGDRDISLLRQIDNDRPVGHQILPTINFNSLNRIISAFHNPSPQTNLAPQCCMCGKKNLSTVEGDGGSECELEDGRWVCSAVCWDRAIALIRPIPDELLNYEAPDFTEDDGYLLEAALQAGSVMLNDDGTVHAFKQEDLLRLIKCAMDRDFTPLWDKPTEGGA